MIHSGELLTTNDEVRVKNLLALSFAEVVTVGSESYPIAVVKEALNAIGVKTAVNAGLKAVSKKVSELSEEQAQELVKVLTK